MRTLTIVLCAASICLAIGCEKDYPGREGQTGFDQKTDGPVNAMKAPADESLLADQGKISREFATEEAPPPAPTPPPAASGAPVDQVKAVMTEMAAAAAKPGQEAQVLAFFDDADAAVLKPVLQIDLKAKADKFTQAVKTKLGTGLPPQIDAMIKMMGQRPASKFAGDVTNFKFKQVGQTVVATSPSGDELTFAKVGSAWKAKLSAQDKAALKFGKAMLDAAVKFLDEATAGVNDGSITKQNLAAKLQELGKKHMGGLGPPSPPPTPPSPAPPPPQPGF